jgi:hypothetical protein
MREICNQTDLNEGIIHIELEIESPLPSLRRMLRRIVSSSIPLEIDLLDHLSSSVQGGHVLNNN